MACHLFGNTLLSEPILACCLLPTCIINHFKCNFWMETFEMPLKFHWSFFQRGQLPINQHCIPWVCYERSFNEFYLSIWNQLVLNQRASVVCSVTTAIFIDFCLKKLNVFSQHIGKKTTNNTNEYLNSAEQRTRNWNVDLVSVLITAWDTT